MNNADVRDELVALQERVGAGSICIDEVGRAFERLTISLAAVNADDDARLRAWVNDIERIRFAELTENQMKAVGEDWTGVRLRADLTILAKLACTLVKARAVPLAA
jgi:hypothetical protein